MRIAGAAAVGTGVSAAFFYGLTLVTGTELSRPFPRSFWPVEMLLSTVTLGSIRLAMRGAYDWSSRTGPGVATQRMLTLLYGAGETGVLMARSAERNPAAGVIPVAFLDDDPGRKSEIVWGLRVLGGLEELQRAVNVTGAQAVLITMPSASGRRVRDVVDAAVALGLEVRTVPSLTDLLDGSVDAHRVRPVRLEDLLRRPVVTTQRAAIDEIVRGKTVLITGAAGSIGSELARQVHALNPGRLVLVDRAESPLYFLERELDSRRERGTGRGEVQIHVASVTNRATMDRLIRKDVPAVIFHAAAYKHVPMMESHPSEAMFTNVAATLMLLDTAAAAGVGRFVFVSTDKAVRPSSVMGATKRVAEMLVADTARKTGRPYLSVRFGNVLGSTGSVVPLFQDQLEKGEPLTITHKDMTRFFMTIPEAVSLILDAAALGKASDLFVLDMGEPVRIIDLARDLVRLSGRDPESQPIKFIGLRPGEKLHEELFYDAEQVQRTPNPKVLLAAGEPPARSVRDDVERLMSLATGETEKLLAHVLLLYANGRRQEIPNMESMPRRVTVATSTIGGITGPRVEPVDGSHGVSERV